MSILLPLFLIKLGCVHPDFENRTAFPWNDNDRLNAATAVMGCWKRHSVDANKGPCLKRFIKLAERDYYAECGFGTND